jgi:hypothetical protein
MSWVVLVDLMRRNKVMLIFNYEFTVKGSDWGKLGSDPKAKLLIASQLQ